MNKNKSNNSLFWHRVILFAGIFGFVVSVLVVANYFQLNRHDPVNTEIINSLVERLNQNPNDEALQNQIREIDLLARKAYFTNQWQIRAGGYLLAIALAIIIIAYQMISLNKRNQVEPNNNTLNVFDIQKKAQNGIIFVVVAIFLFAGILVILTSKQLENQFSKRLATSNEIEQVTEEKIPEQQPKVEQNNKPVEKSESVAEKSESPKITNQQANEGEEEKGQKQYTKSTDNNIFKKNYSSFRGYNGLGISYQKNIPTNWDGASGKNIKWKAKIPLQGYNSPIIWEDKLFLTGANANNREVYCYNRITGKLLWQTPIIGIEGSPTQVPKTTDDTGLAAPTMATDGKLVFAIFGTGDVVALNMDGKIVWGRNLGVPQNHYGHSSSLLVYKSKLIVQYDQKGDAKVLALNTSSGKTVWSTSRDVKISWASPILINADTKPELILVAEPTVNSYNPDSGKENWNIDCMYGEVGPSAAYDNRIVFALNEYAVLVAIKLGKEPELLWEGDMYLSDVPSPVAANGLLLVATSYGAIVCHDAKTGDIYWEQELGNNIYSSPILVGDMVYLIDMKGITHIFKMSKEFEKVAAPALGESSVCTPAFADGHIYIRAGNNLYAIGK